MFKFSIIVPAYNEEKTIGQCLSSLIELDFNEKEYEIILVNNNSSDKTKEIAQSYLGRRELRIIDEPQQGNVFALRRGCAEARGEILAFTDADTQVPRDWLKKLDSAYQEKEVVCVGGPGKLHPPTFLSFWGELVFFWGGRLTKLAPCFNLSIRKAIYEKIGGFDPKINFHQDVALVLKAKREGKVVFLKDNWVVSSSRHFRGWPGIVYIAKAWVNFLFLFLFKRTVFWDFGVVR